MPILTIRLEMHNVAFEDSMANESARILRETATRIEENGDRFGILRDLNGNNCGEFSVH